MKKEMVLEVEKARLEIRRNFFSIRAAKAWNKLPEAIKQQTSVNAFKNKYDAWKITQTTENIRGDDSERNDEGTDGEERL